MNQTVREQEARAEGKTSIDGKRVDISMLSDFSDILLQIEGDDHIISIHIDRKILKRLKYSYDYASAAIRSPETFEGTTRGPHGNVRQCRS